MDFEKLGITINQIFRYAYGGILILFVSAIVNPNQTKIINDSLGSTLSIFVAFGLGGLIHAFYKPFILEQFIAKIAWKLHKILEKKWGFDKNNPLTHNEPYGFLMDFQRVKKNNVIMAYRLIRDNLFDKDRAKRFELEHSEIHLLYMTFSILVIFGILIWFFPSLNTNESVSYLVLIIAAIIFLITGIWGDLIVKRRICAYLKSIDQVKLTTLLKDTGFIT